MHRLADRTDFGRLNRSERKALWVPKTCVTWADALESAVPCPVPGEPVAARPFREAAGAP
jgi:hypothetical protein